MVVASIVSVVYGVVIAVVAAHNSNYLYFALFGMIPVFVLTYFFCYTLKTGMIKFLSFKKIREKYDNTGRDYFKSEYDKDSESFVAAVLCFFPTLIFYFLFSWIFYLVKK